MCLSSTLIALNASICLFLITIIIIIIIIIDIIVINDIKAIRIQMSAKYGRMINKHAIHMFFDSSVGSEK